MSIPLLTWFGQFGEIGLMNPGVVEPGQHGALMGIRFLGHLAILVGGGLSVAGG